MGTIVNALAIIVGSIVGLLIKKGIKENYQDIVNKALGLAVIIIGLNGVFTNMISIEETKLVSNNELLLIISLVLGALIGEWLNIDDRLSSIASKIERKFKLSSFASGFISASIIYCVGAMAIIGSLNDGLLNDPSVLYLKSTLDGLSSIVLSAGLGIGVVFSAIPVLIYQGILTLFAGSLSGILNDVLLSSISMVGYVLVMGIGINFLFNIKLKIANFLPALLIPVIYQFILLI